MFSFLSKGTHAIHYLAIGALFGASFPVFATLFLLIHEHLSFSWSSAAHLHTTRPLLLIINTAPIFLGLFAAVAGMKQDMVVEYNKSLRKANEKLAREINEKNAMAQRFKEEKIKARNV